ncbi:MAG TPA: PEP-CTERM sorting domain-containing protein [Casimicrobiaceae bacterium]|nr:PEP-CTERM sorting domain-containing protein [Casimicrobiaceae bacterium]
MTKNWSVRGVLAIAGLLFASAVLAQRVAVLGGPNSPSWNNDVQSKLVSTGLFPGGVDIINISTTTPSLATLKQYNAVLVYSDGAGFADGVTLGNNLADYVDAGGGVVTAVFITASIPLTGRFNSANYYIIQPTSQQSGSQQTLGTVYLPADPLMAGVTSFNGGTNSYRPSSSSLHPGAVRVADWSGPGTIPLIAKGMINGHPRVDLGFYPPSVDARSDFWLSSTNGARIMANALLFVAGGGFVVPTLQPIMLVVLSLGLMLAVAWWMRRSGMR